MMRTIESSEAQRIAQETTTAKAKAQALLHGLMEAKADADRRLSADRRLDAFKAVTGRSAMDNAIASTRQLIETLDGALETIDPATPTRRAEHALR